MPPQKTPPPPVRQPSGNLGGGPGSAAKAGTPSSGNVLKRRDSCLEQIQLLQQKRAERRESMNRKRTERAAEEKRLSEAGIPGDVDFQRMIARFREERGTAQLPHVKPGDLKICICVRKRPINEKEKKRKDYDAVTCLNPVVMVHDCKLRVDGITKFLDNTDFAFDHTFGEDDTTDQLYHYTAAPLIPFIFNRQGRATCFAYGQTGSGKTYTMAGIQQFAARDIFKMLKTDQPWKEKAPTGLSLYVSFFEIYGGRCQDLLNNRHRLVVREDGRGDVVITGLEECEAQTEEDLLAAIERGNRNRTTHATEVNDVSSRSHAICQIVLRHRESGRMFGKLSLVDLAGSERGADTKSHNRQRRMESAEINKSLLALKECIRALDSDSVHVPYRASKLTLVLKDCFTKENARTVMIATVSPGASSADHTINTLRYADRVKEKNVGEVEQPPFMPLDAEPKGAGPRGGGWRGDKAGGARHQLDGDFEDEDPEDADWEDEDDGGAEEEDDEDEEAGGLKAARAAARARNRSSSEDDIERMHQSLRKSHKAGGGSPRGRRGGGAAADDVEDDDDDDVVELHRAVQSLLDDEEALLNMHMNVIQENADLLTEEGRLLQQIQGDEVVDYDIDAYASRLDQILDRKLELITTLKTQLSAFRTRLQEEETASKRVGSMPQY